MPSDAVDPTTIGTESGRVALQRRREARVDHVYEIPFNERVEITCRSCGETISVGIHGVEERSYDTCWTWDCDAYHKFDRDRDAETPDETESVGTRQTTLITDGGRVQDGDAVYQGKGITTHCPRKKLTTAITTDVILHHRSFASSSSISDSSAIGSPSDLFGPPAFAEMDMTSVPFSEKVNPRQLSGACDNRGAFN